MIHFPTSARLLFAGSVSAAIAFACAAPQNSSPATPEPEPAKVEVNAPAEQVTDDSAATAARSFDQMSPPERLEHMKKVVLPEMKALFQSGGGEEEFSCKSCHGARAAQGDFRMPNPDLPPLDFKDGLADEKKEHPAAVEFMMKKVTPEMARLLGEAPYNPETGKGFGCLGCHTAAGG